MSKTTRFFIIYTMYFILATVAYVLFYLHIGQKVEETTRTNMLIADIQEQNKQFENLSTIVEDTKEGREKITDYFIVGEDSFVKFLESIEKIGEISGVEVEVGAINNTESDVDTIKVLSLGVNFEGEWSNVHHFLVLFESFPLKITLDGLRMSEIKETVVVEGEEDREITKWKGNARIRTLQIVEEDDK